MNTVALGDLVDFHSGGTPSKSKPELWDGNVPWFSAKDIKQAILTDSIDHISDAAFKTTSLRKIPAGTLVMVVRGMILAHTVPISIINVDAAINQDLKALIPRQEIEVHYLAAMLRAQHADILQRVSVAAHGTKKLESHILEGIQIPLPPLSEQRRIAGILYQADTIRAKRRQILAHLDTLTLSIFHDMFGNPDEAAEIVPFGEVAGLSGGRNLVADDVDTDSPYRVLKISAVTSGKFKPKESKPLPKEYEPPSDHLVRRGDLLISRANTAELVGAVAYVDETPPNLALPDKIWRFEWRTTDRVPTFYHALFQTSSIRRRISRLSSGTSGSMKNISKAKLESMPLPNMPVVEQCIFADRIGHVNAHRTLVQRALDADNELFASLQSRAFRGEL